MKAKAVALMEGLEFCLTLGLQHVIVEMESQSMLNSGKGLHRHSWWIDAELVRISQVFS